MLSYLRNQLSRAGHSESNRPQANEVDDEDERLRITTEVDIALNQLADVTSKTQHDLSQLEDQSTELELLAYQVMKLGLPFEAAAILQRGNQIHGEISMLTDRLENLQHTCNKLAVAKQHLIRANASEETHHNSLDENYSEEQFPHSTSYHQSYGIE